MKIDVIDNDFLAVLKNQLRDGLLRCSEAKLATAFLTNDAVQLIENAIEQANKKNRRLQIQLVVGLYQRFTPPSVLKKLNSLQKKYKESLQVKVAAVNRFHWKLYSIRKGHQSIVFIGSSNLTSDGLSAEGELNVRLLGSSHERAIMNLRNAFEDLWNRKNNSFNLTDNLVNSYKKVKRPPRFVLQRSDPIIESLLRSAKKSQIPEEPQPPKKSKVALSWVGEEASNATKKVVRQKTNWDAKGWWYMCYAAKSDRDWLASHKEFVLADFSLR